MPKRGASRCEPSGDQGAREVGTEVPVIQSLQLDGFLSFAPGSPAFELQPLNVLIGPNGAGKSNFIDAFGVLAATPTDFAAAVRRGGGAEEWAWKGEGGGRAGISVVLDAGTPTGLPLRYGLEFGLVRLRADVFDEFVEDAKPLTNDDSVSFYDRFQSDASVVSQQHEGGRRPVRVLQEARLLGASP